MDMASLLKYAVECGASDIHITPGIPPGFRISGEINLLQTEALTGDDTKRLLYSILTDEQKATFEEKHELDFSIGIPDISRFRVNIMQQKGTVAGVMRTISNYIPTMEELGLSQVFYDLARLPNGIVLITGPTGSGKSTTLASIINLINEERREHILTIEDPIEFVHPHKGCIVNQRELNADTFSFASALKASLREDPDVVLVGEMRDLETITAALTIAETGHLVFSTLHTTSASQTVDRIIDVFPPYQQEQIRVLLAATLRAVVTQQLIMKEDGSGRTSAQEIMKVVPGIAAMIREGKTHQIYSAIQTGKQYGMQTMEEALAQLVRKRMVSMDEALRKTNNPQDLKKLLGRV